MQSSKPLALLYLIVGCSPPHGSIGPRVFELESKEHFSCPYVQTKGRTSLIGVLELGHLQDFVCMATFMILYGKVWFICLQEGMSRLGNARIPLILSGFINN